MEHYCTVCKKKTRFMSWLAEYFGNLFNCTGCGTVHNID